MVAFLASVVYPKAAWPSSTRAPRYATDLARNNFHHTGKNPT